MKTTVVINGIDDKVYESCTANVDEEGVLNIITHPDSVVEDEFDSGDWDKVIIEAPDE